MLMSLAAPTAIAQRLPLNVEDYLADNYAMMRDYGRCSVHYAHRAQMLELANRAYAMEAEDMWGRARDMKAAADTAFSNVKAPADASAAEARKVEATIAAYTRSLDSIIALETTRQKALAEHRKFFEIEQMNFCWRKMTQRVVIEALRKQGIFSGN
jgi:hypothetical protein